MMIKVQYQQRVLVVSFSVVIVTHGREELLTKCLESLKPESENWELLLTANGRPLPQEILDLAEKTAPRLKLITHETQQLPGKARNEALKEVSGEWIFFLDDDAVVLPGYWRQVEKLLEDSRIDVLGGPDAPVKGMSSLAHALSLALASPLCTGTTFYRHKSFGTGLKAASEQKLTSCNLWVRKSAMAGVSFPEDYLRAEENYFLEKLQASGRKLFYHPLLKVGHHRRPRLKLLLRPSFYAGYYRSRLMREKFTDSGNIFWLPSLFVLLHGLMFIDQESFWYLVRMYVSIVLFVSLSLSMQARRTSLFPLVAFLHWFIVFMFGVGFLYERAGGGVRR